MRLRNKYKKKTDKAIKQQVAKEISNYKNEKDKNKNDTDLQE